MIAYDRLSQIIPPDLALSNKALQVAFQQISGISGIDLPTLANTVLAVQTTRNLPLLTQQTQPITGDTRAYYLNVLGAYGTGVCNSLLTVDMLGTAIGTVNNQAFANTVAALSTMDTSGLQNIYQTMINCLNGDYNTFDITDPLNPIPYVEIPAGSPAAGDYLTIDDAFTGNGSCPYGLLGPGPGLIPTAYSALQGLVATYPSQCATMTNAFDAICQQMGNEQDLQVRSGLDFSNFFGNLQPNNQSATFAFIFALPQYGLQLIEGDAASFLEGIADYNPITGTMTIGSPVITDIPSFLGVTTGNSVAGTGIAEGSTVSSFNPGLGTLTMSNPSTMTIANTSAVVGNIGGQAIIGVMRQATNQAALNSSGILPNNNVPLTYPTAPTPAQLVSSTYTVPEALQQIIK